MQKMRKETEETLGFLVTFFSSVNFGRGQLEGDPPPGYAYDFAPKL